MKTDEFVAKLAELFPRETLVEIYNHFKEKKENKIKPKKKRKTIFNK